MISFISFSQQLFHVPDDLVLPIHIQELATIWEKKVWDQVCLSKFGYAKTEVYTDPILEDQVRAIMTPLLGKNRIKEKQPTICLTHDVDYLRSTVQMNLKRCVATKSLLWKNDCYFDSIKKVAAYDLDLANSSTFFVAAPSPAPFWLQRAKQWLLDPSYHNSIEDLNELLKILNRKGIEIGIHGSFFSHELDLLKFEIEALSSRVKSKITSGRQHWLHLPHPQEDFDRMIDSGIMVDSTLGWNGSVGFRCGVTHPLTYMSKKGKLDLVPMSLMDGPLFDDLHLSTDEAVSISHTLLEKVFERSGTVSIDWHERCAHPSYRWFDAYEKITTWAKKRGFTFKCLSQIAGENQ